MHLELFTRNPSAHPSFTRTTMLKPDSIWSNQSKTIDVNFKRSGRVVNAFEAWGRYGMLCGMLESLGDHPVEGTVVVTISHGSYEVTGTIEAYDHTCRSEIHKMLQAVERLAHDLSRDPSVLGVQVKYAQRIKVLQGGFNVL